MQIDGFQWDDGNREKCQKHGVSIVEIEALFGSGDLIVLADPFEHEERLRGVGRTSGGRYIFMVWTLRETADGSTDPSDQRQIYACQGSGLL